MSVPGWSTGQNTLIASSEENKAPLITAYINTPRGEASSAPPGRVVRFVLPVGGLKGQYNAACHSL